MKTWSKMKNPHQRMRPFILRCGDSHPYGSFCYCSSLMTKSNSEIRRILKSPAVHACRCCVQLQGWVGQPHNTTNCTFKKKRCAICVSNKKDNTMALSHPVILCYEAHNNNGGLKKVYMESEDYWRKDRLLRI